MMSRDRIYCWSRIAAAVAAGGLGAALAGSAAGAAELTVLTVGGPVPVVMGALAPAFEHASGDQVAIQVESTPTVLSRIKAGEPVDLVIAISEAIDDLARAGKLGAGGRLDLFRSSVGLAVRAGLPKPDISSADALRAALLDAKSIAYSRGPSGNVFAGVLQRLGIADAIKPKLVAIESGPVGAAVAKGAADIGVQQVAELMPIPGIELVGPLPPALQAMIVYSAGIPAKAARPSEAMGLVKFFASEPAKDVLQTMAVVAAQQDQGPP